MVIYLILFILILLIYILYFRNSNRQRDNRQQLNNSTIQVEQSIPGQTSDTQDRAAQYADYKVRSFRQEVYAKQPWFNPNSLNDQKVTTYSEPQDPVEVDTIDALRLSQLDLFNFRNQFIVYQQWGKLLPDGGRPFYWLDADTATTVAEIIKGGPTRKLIFICTTFAPGAIQFFADTLVQDQQNKGINQLEFMGFFWYFSGDDITDDPERATEIAYAANTLQLKRLSILTGAFNQECEDRLVEGLQQNSTLEHLSVFLKDEDYTWERIYTPKIDELLQNNRSS